MAEVPSLDPKFLDTDDEAQRQYEGSPFYVNARRELNRYTNPLVDIYGDIIEAAQLNGTEAIGEIGCGDGTFIKRILDDFQHQGSLTGIDKYPNGFFGVQSELASRAPGQVRFMEGDAASLDIEDGAFDVTFFDFVIYHMIQQREALEELKRVTRDKVIIATKGEENLRRLHDISAEAAGGLGLVTPGSPYPNGDFVKTAEHIEAVFPREEGYITNLIRPVTRIEAPADAWIDIFNALVSVGTGLRYKDTNEHAPDEEVHFRRVLRSEFRPRFLEEARLLGYFAIGWDQGFFVVQKAA